MIFIVELAILIAVGVAVTLIVNKVSKDNALKGSKGSEKEGLLKLVDRIGEIEKFCVGYGKAFNENAEKYNNTKNQMVDELKDMHKFISDAGEIINSNVDDIKEIEEVLLDLKVLTHRVTKGLANKPKSRRVFGTRPKKIFGRINISNNHYKTHWIN
jgi:hypothetical protein